jgi:hypothetical protein
VFLIHSDYHAARKAIEKLHATLTALNPTPIVAIPVKSHWLFWFGCKPSDNLHSFNNGFIVGKLTFHECCSPRVSASDTDPPEALHPLLHAVKVGIGPTGITLAPWGITNVYYDGSSASDMQLLLADANGHVPSPCGFAVLATVGYLPGNVTLFERIRKIPFLHAYDVTQGKLISLRSFVPREPDDAAMVDRCTAIVPQHSNQIVGISGGYDSRFVLGVLMRAGIRPTLLHLDGAESPIVAQLGAALGLEARLLAHGARLPDDLLAILTDGQRHLSEGNYHTLWGALSRDSIYHSGLFAEALVKNAFKTAWKVPGPRRYLLDRLIRRALLSTAPQELNGLSACTSRAEIAAFLKDELAFLKEPCSCWSRKAAANWFHYVNQGLRWCQAYTGALAYFAYPVFLVSDLDALAVGIASSFWCNFRKDRVRRLNYKLMPEVEVPYCDGRPARPDGWLREQLLKIPYEYGTRLGQWLEAHRRFKRAGRTSGESTDAREYGCGLPEMRRYIKADTSALLADRGCSINVKRATKTLYHVMNYLLRGPVEWTVP